MVVLMYINVFLLLSLFKAILVFDDARTLVQASSSSKSYVLSLTKFYVVGVVTGDLDA